MPVCDDPSHAPSGRLLVADGGRVLARFVIDERERRPRADGLAAADGVALEQLVPAIRRDLAGHRVRSTVEVGLALIAAGAQPRRHFHIMRRSLQVSLALVAAPPGIAIGPVDRPAAEFGDALVAAFPRGHVDWEPGDEDPAFQAARLQRLMDGEEAGPMLPASRIAVDAGGRGVGAAIVTDADGTPPFTGTWLSELFRHPSLRGTGGALLFAALRSAADAGHESIGLAVTEGNGARALYAAAGFEVAESAISVELPDAAVSSP